MDSSHHSLRRSNHSTASSTITPQPYIKTTLDANGGSPPDTPVLMARQSNPVRYDPALLALKQKLAHIRKHKSFHKWRTTFLERLDDFLAQEGMAPASAACTSFGALLNKQLRMAAKVSNHVDKGELSVERKTVKSTLALQEMCGVLSKVVATTQTLIPPSQKEEDALGFTKFHVGAALIRQGFTQYGSLLAIQEFCQAIGPALRDVADKQQHVLFDYYVLVLERFMDVIRDIGLHDVMLACARFQEAPEEDESSSCEPITVQLKVRTVGGDDTQTISLEVDVTETIGNIKEYIANGCGIPPDRQVLTWDEDELDDAMQTLEGLGIEDAATFTVAPRRVPITVRTMDGESFSLLVDPSQSLAALKEELVPLAQIPVENQQLSLVDSGTVLDDSTTALEDHGIVAGTVLDLAPKMIQVNVTTPDGATHRIAIKPADDVDAMKQHIAAVTGLPAAKQILRFNGTELATPGQSARALGIREGDSLEADIFKVPVTVHTMDGQQLDIMVDPTDSIADLKRQLEPLANLATDNQCISKEGVELDDPDQTAAACGIQGGTVLDLAPHTMSITVEAPDGTAYPLSVKPSHTVEDVKSRVEALTGLAVPRQILKHKGRQLPSHQTLREIGVQPGDAVQVELFMVPVTVNTPNGTVEIMVDPHDTLASMKRTLEGPSGLTADNQRLFLDQTELADDDKVAGDYGIAPGTVLDLEPKSMHITVETPNGESFMVDIDPADTTERIKHKVQDKTGMAVSQQLLKHKGRELVDDKTARDMGIQDGDKLTAEIYKVPVTVRSMDGSELHIMVDPTQTISAIKLQLESECGLAADNQRLFQEGNELTDGKTAQDYGIQGGSILDLDPKKLHVTIQTPDGQSLPMELEPSFSIESVKEMIESQISLSVPQQVLEKNGKTLKNAATVRSCGIVDGDTLQVDIFKVPVTVNTMDGKKIKLMIDPHQQISEIKRELEAASGIPMENQVLLQQDTELQNEKRAIDYAIQGGSILDLEPNHMAVTAQTPDGQVHAVQLCPSDSLDEIKVKIAQASGLAAARQVVKLAGKKLQDGLRAKDMGIQDGSALMVDLYTIPITVVPTGGTEFSLHVEPSQSIDAIKKMCEEASGIPAKKHILTLGEAELSNGRKSAEECGIVRDSTLLLDILSDDIVFVDVKCGTLFGMDRGEVIEKAALTPVEGNKLDFLEAAKDSIAREKLFAAMKDSPRLGVARQVVVLAGEVDDYDITDAAAVQGMWGVSLKKVQKNKKGEEFIFIDPKTGACGELSRKKHIASQFITTVSDKKEGETLAEREQDVQTYDRHIASIRRVFGV
jgi:hypothetical protein